MTKISTDNLSFSNLLCQNHSLHVQVRELLYHCEIYKLSLRSIQRQIQKQTLYEENKEEGEITSSSSSNSFCLRESNSKYRIYLTMMSQKRTLQTIHRVILKAKRIIKGSPSLSLEKGKFHSEEGMDWCTNPAVKEKNQPLPNGNNNGIWISTTKYSSSSSCPSSTILDQRANGMMLIPMASSRDASINKKSSQGENKSETVAEIGIKGKEKTRHSPSHFHRKEKEDQNRKRSRGRLNNKGSKHRGDRDRHDRHDQHCIKTRKLEGSGPSTRNKRNTHITLKRNFERSGDTSCSKAKLGRSSLNSNYRSDGSNKVLLRNSKCSSGQNGESSAKDVRTSRSFSKPRRISTSGTNMAKPPRREEEEAKGETIIRHNKANDKHSSPSSNTTKSTKPTNKPSGTGTRNNRESESEAFKNPSRNPNHCGHNKPCTSSESGSSRRDEVIIKKRKQPHSPITTTTTDNNLIKKELLAKSNNEEEEIIMKKKQNVNIRIRRKGDEGKVQRISVYPDKDENDHRHKDAGGSSRSGRRETTPIRFRMNKRESEDEGKGPSFKKKYYPPPSLSPSHTSQSQTNPRQDSHSLLGRK